MAASGAPGHLDVVVVGAGFSGLYALHRLRALGLRVVVLEREQGVGGTWYANRYPGARCDIESVDYCYSFDDDLVREWRWTERYPAQPEILAYLDHVADRFDLRRDIELGTTVTEMEFDDASNRWTVRAADGRTWSATHVVLGVGNLSAPMAPDIPGLDDFGGRWLHTGMWPREPVDLDGHRVAVVGTGSSGIQTITALGPVVEQLYVLQRTPNYSMPARNRPLTDDEVAEVLAGWPERRERCRSGDAGTPRDLPTTHALDVSEGERREGYERGWAEGGISALSFAWAGMFRSEEANRLAADFAREKIRSIVRDPATAEALCPEHHIGTKRTCVDTGYFETYNRPNVELVNLRNEPLRRITRTGIAVGEREIEVDTIIFAIGFDAITGALERIDIRGRDGVSLREAWAHGPETYLGLQVAGFPNLFLVTGPGSPSVLSNMVVSIEQHVDLIADTLAHLREVGADRIEATGPAQREWTAHVGALADETLYPRAKSWYMGVNVPGKPRVFSIYIAGCGAYREACRDAVADGYRGFAITSGADREANT